MACDEARTFVTPFSSKFSCKSSNDSGKGSKANDGTVWMRARDRNRKIANARADIENRPAVLNRCAEFLVLMIEARFFHHPNVHARANAKATAIAQIDPGIRDGDAEKNAQHRPPILDAEKECRDGRQIVTESRKKHGDDFRKTASGSPWVWDWANLGWRAEFCPQVRREGLAFRESARRGRLVSTVVP